MMTVSSASSKVFWPGAVVRWIGATQTIEGARLEPGGTLRIVDPGRFGTGAFTTLVSGPRRSLGDQVLVATEQGHEAKVSPDDLETIPTDHPMAPEPDVSRSHWLTEQLDAWPAGQGMPVASLVPQSFGGVAIVLHPWQRTSDNAAVTWAEVAAAGQFAGAMALLEALEPASAEGVIPGYRSPLPGGLPRSTAEALTSVLAEHITT